MKQCSKCKEIKPISDFHLTTNGHGWNGPGSTCKLCKRKAVLERKYKKRGYGKTQEPFKKLPGRKCINCSCKISPHNITGYCSKCKGWGCWAIRNTQERITTAWIRYIEAACSSWNKRYQPGRQKYIIINEWSTAIRKMLYRNKTQTKRLFQSKWKLWAETKATNHNRRHRIKLNNA